jgi:hypothetical protein
MTKNLRLLLVASALLMFPIGAVQGGDDGCSSCSTPSPWLFDDPFEESRILYSPYTYGLAIGDDAPGIPGVQLLGQRSIVAVFNSYASVEVAALGALARPDLQVVVVLSDVGDSSVQDAISRFGQDVHVITDPEARIVCAEYRVGPDPVVAQLAFFIDERGKVIQRRFGKPGWLVSDDAAIADWFSAHGTIPPTMDPQHVVWYGDAIAWPTFNLKDIDGADRKLGPGRPLLIYRGFPPSSVRGERVFRDLDTLRSEFPEVEFVWLFGYVTDEALSDLWHLYTYYDLPSGGGEEWFSMPLDEYMTAAVEGRNEQLDQDVEDIRSNAPDWTLLYDPGSRLASFWGMPGYPSIMILSANGEVLLPFTLYPVLVVDGRQETHPNALSALLEILQTATRSD